VFKFHRDSLTQELIGFKCLCYWCHITTHFGFAQRIGLGREAHKHLRKINKWSGAQAHNYVHQKFKAYRAIAHLEWKVDLSYVDKYIDRGDMIDPISILSTNRGER